MSKERLSDPDVYVVLSNMTKKEREAHEKFKLAWKEAIHNNNFEPGIKLGIFLPEEDEDQ